MCNEVLGFRDEIEKLELGILMLPRSKEIYEEKEMIQ